MCPDARSAQFEGGDAEDPFLGERPDGAGVHAGRGETGGQAVRLGECHGGGVGFGHVHGDRGPADRGDQGVEQCAGVLRRVREQGADTEGLATRADDAVAGDAAVDDAGEGAVSVPGEPGGEEAGRSAG